MITENDVYADCLLAWDDELNEIENKIRSVRKKLKMMTEQAYNPWAFAYLGKTSRLPKDLATIESGVYALAKNVRIKEQQTACWKCGNALRVMNLALGVCNQCSVNIWQSRNADTGQSLINAIRYWVIRLREDEHFMASAEENDNIATAKQRNQFFEWLSQVDLSR